jgi:hypothetical protein
MATQDQTGDELRCRAWAAALAHCHATLVVHADGVVDCEERATCGAEAALHEWWMPCTELAPQCGCTGDEQPLAELGAMAA